MIYPHFFPESRKNEHAERNFFDRITNLKEKYDIFYSKTFLHDQLKKECEIDFIIAPIPNRKERISTILCIEVKGGQIEYNGEKNVWVQNGLEAKKDFVGQATSASHFIVNKYPDISKDVNIEWVLCFPDCEKPQNTPLPTNINEIRIIDKLELLYLDQALETIIESFSNSSNRQGAGYWIYDNFKKNMLRKIGFVETLGARFKYEEEKFVQLTNMQIDFFNRISNNKNIIVNGYAGSGKTLVAIAAAKEKLADGKKVLFTCFNRTLSNKIRYSFDRNDTIIEVKTFYALAKDLIDKKYPNWWEKHDEKSDDFWELEVPSLLDEVIDSSTSKYDAIIIDEGQDFKELWYELLFKLVNKDGYKFIFIDPFQDIFSNYNKIPGIDNFIKFDLVENCRNTKTIVSELSEIINQNIATQPDLPSGDKIIKLEFNNPLELSNGVKKHIKDLVNKENINSKNILIMLNSKKKDSSIANLNKIGKLEISGLARSSKIKNDHIHFTTINVFKGLEVDVLFIIDAQNINNGKLLYTQISRARKMCYIFSCK